MSNAISIAQIILDAQRMQNRVKDLEALGNALLIEAEGNNRQLESMRQYQDDMDSLNKLARDKSNTDMVNRINQQNPSIREIRQENRELKACLEDHQRALEVIMHKYREHMQHKILSSQVNFSSVYNENLSKVIRDQSEKINEMAAVMQKAASADDETIYKEIETLNKLKLENQGLRELLQISNQFGSAGIPITTSFSEDKAIQTEMSDDSNVENSEENVTFDNSNASQDINLNCLESQNIGSDTNPQISQPSENVDSTKGQTNAEINKNETVPITAEDTDDVKDAR